MAKKFNRRSKRKLRRRFKRRAVRRMYKGKGKSLGWITKRKDTRPKASRVVYRMLGRVPFGDEILAKLRFVKTIIGNYTAGNQAEIYLDNGQTSNTAMNWISMVDIVNYFGVAPGMVEYCNLFHVYRVKAIKFKITCIPLNRSEEGAAHLDTDTYMWFWFGQNNLGPVNYDPSSLFEQRFCKYKLLNNNFGTRVPTLKASMNVGRQVGNTLGINDDDYSNTTTTSFPYHIAPGNKLYCQGGVVSGTGIFRNTTQVMWKIECDVDVAYFQRRELDTA